MVKKAKTEITYSVRLPIKLDAELTKLAEKEKRSKNSEILVLLEFALTKVKRRKMT